MDFKRGGSFTTESLDVLQIYEVDLNTISRNKFPYITDLVDGLELHTTALEILYDTS